MKIKNLFPGSWSSNCYVVSDNGHAIIIDPSAPESDIVEYLKSEDLTPESIVLTHGHFDHISSLDTLRKVTGIGACIHEKDAELLCDGAKNAFSLFLGGDLRYRPAELLLHDGDIISVGNLSFKVISTPGHTAGSICLLCEDVMFTGDTLFANSYGRCDLYSGNREALFKSLRSLKNYDPKIRIFPGHGQDAILGNALDNAFYY